MKAPTQYSTDSAILRTAEHSGAGTTHTPYPKI
jgi:hypothetical protein